MVSLGAATQGWSHMGWSHMASLTFSGQGSGVMNRVLDLESEGPDSIPMPSQYPALQISTS